MGIVPRILAWASPGGPSSSGFSDAPTPTRLVLSTVSNTLRYQHDIPEGAVLTARMGDVRLRCTTSRPRVSGRRGASVLLPAFHLDGVVVVQPHWRGNSVDPAGPPVRVVALSDPILLEEVRMFVAEVADSLAFATHGGGERRPRASVVDLDASGAAPTRGLARRIIDAARRTLIGRDDAERREDANHRGGSVRGGTLHDANGEANANDDDFADANAASAAATGLGLGSGLGLRKRRGRSATERTPSPSRDAASDEMRSQRSELNSAGASSRSFASPESRADDALLWLSRVMFDDRCPASDLREGCELAGRAGLLRVLHAAGERLVDRVSRPGTYGELVALARSRPPLTMHHVAATWCEDTLRTLFALVGSAEERREGAAATLFGRLDAPVDPSVSDWSPLHTAAKATKTSGDALTGAQFCVMMVGCTPDPHVWTRGCGSSVRRRRNSGGEWDTYENNDPGGFGDFGPSPSAGPPGGGPFTATAEDPEMDPESDAPSDDAASDAPSDDTVASSVGFTPGGLNGAANTTNGWSADRWTTSRRDGGFFARGPGFNNAWTGDERAPAPAELASAEVCAVVRDFYEAAALAVVHAVSVVATANVTAATVAAISAERAGVAPSATAQTAGRIGHPPLSFEDATDALIVGVRDPQLAWMATNLMSDEACWDTLLNIYECAGPSAVWRPFPERETVAALMWCLGWNSERGEREMLRKLGVLDQRDGGESCPPFADSSWNAARRTGARSADGSGIEAPGNTFARTPTDSRAGSEQRRGAPFAGDGEEGPGAWERLSEATRPLLAQTPWLTSSKLGLLGLMTFADPDLERDWRASGATRVGAAQSAFFAAVMIVNVAARVACGDARKIADAVRLFFRDGFATGSSPALLVRCLPTIFAGVFFAARWAFFARGTKGGGPRPRTRFALDVGDVVALLYVAAEAGTSLEATYFGDDFGGLAADAWSADDRSFFSRGALRDRTGRLCATAAVSRAASVWLAPSTARRKFAFALLSWAVSALRFGAFAGEGGARVFVTAGDALLRFVVSFVAAAGAYLREYHHRFSFLMKHHAPGRSIRHRNGTRKRRGGRT